MSVWSSSPVTVCSIQITIYKLSLQHTNFIPEGYLRNLDKKDVTRAKKKQKDSGKKGTKFLKDLQTGNWRSCHTSG